MENMFYYMCDDIKNEELSGDGQGRNAVVSRSRFYSPILKLAKTASMLTISTKKLYYTTSVYRYALLAKHQLKTIIGGFGSVLYGRGRPSWSNQVRFGLHWLRESLLFEYNTISAVRYGQSMAVPLITYLNDTVQTVTVSVNVSKLLSYEISGKDYTNLTETWRYPIPAEDAKYIANIDKLSIQGEWVFPKSQASKKAGKIGKVIYYLHGGCYIIGSAAMYRSLTSLLSSQCNCPVFALDYRLAPEHPFPAALHDAFAGYMYLIEPKNSMFDVCGDHEAISPQNIIIAGDSAGGGLTMALLNYINMYLRSQSGDLVVPLPRCAILLSPWVDLSCSSKSWEDNKGLDFLPQQATDLHSPVAKYIQHPVFSYCFGEGHTDGSLNYTGGRDVSILSPVGSCLRIPSVGVALASMKAFDRMNPRASSSSRKKDRDWLELVCNEVERDALERFVRHPLVSPVFGNMLDLPPLLIVIIFNKQAGECELLRDETIGLAYKYKRQNKKNWVRHELYTDMVHDFQVASSLLPSAILSMRQIVHFVAEVFDKLEKRSLSVEEMNLMKMIDSHANYE